ncbi:bacillithiol biosynthesis deacetylase BshB2 [Cerasibacillus terrae]|uniref:Bacillithiol biosynthesis deacetylase BshB2 n=1 Tax=Cerasibacillus terrae TaxID=2498845 RepID=A0A5C8NUW9_9BACI|nr:bacillithiol biosynthesis deacetylase BshB2 [Cerasibacillus terrae]TXL64989.1 bacillithiol biosynthesis deacetylase BshB2 [Cerasibacillus terrae]
MEKEKHVVVIYPHPDDESFGAAGTITAFRKQNVPVTYLCGTLGEMGRNMGSPIIANRETIPKIREKELRDACQVLDIELELLGYRDKTLEFEDPEKVANHIQTILEQIEPSLVITHYPKHAVHPDHNALGAAVIRAVQQMQPNDRPKVWAQAITNTAYEDLGLPDISHDIMKYLDKKVEAILAHKTQAAGILGSFKPESKKMETMKEIVKERLGKEEFYIWKFS